MAAGEQDFVLFEQVCSMSADIVVGDYIVASVTEFAREEGDVP